MAQPYGHGAYDSRPIYHTRYGDSDRAEWNQDRDRDGRPDQHDAYDNRRDRHQRHHRAWSQQDNRYGYDRGYRDNGYERRDGGYGGYGYYR